MKNRRSNWLLFSWMLLGLAASPQVLQAQDFNFLGDGDMMAGFRKEGGNQGTNELVVYVGNITNYLAMSPGSSITVANVNAARLTDSFGDGYTNIQWSVFGANYEDPNTWVTPVGTFPPSTLWYTIPRGNASVQSTAPPRAALNVETEVATSISSVDSGANSVGAALGTTNADNNTILVREPVQDAYSQWLLTTFIEDNPSDSITADFGHQAFTYTIENTNNPPFNSTVRSDLYEVPPKSTSVHTYTDPFNGTTNLSYWVGYFDFATNGTMTFTRASTTAPAPSLKITLSGITNIISFGASNGVTYNLIYTNLAGITAPRSNWFPLGSSIIGAGNNTNFTDTNSGGAGRVYSVTAH